jgi:predicted site-specific integrase-resolvase
MICGCDQHLTLKEWTVKQYASLEQVDTSTVRRWILKGAVEVRRTPGGGIRVLGTRR